MWDNQNQIHKGKLIGPSEGAGIMSSLADTGAEMFIQHGIPWLGKQAVKQGRYFTSAADDR